MISLLVVIPPLISTDDAVIEVPANKDVIVVFPVKLRSTPDIPPLKIASPLDTSDFEVVNVAVSKSLVAFTDFAVTIPSTVVNPTSLVTYTLVTLLG